MNGHDDESDDVGSPAKTLDARANSFDAFLRRSAADCVNAQHRPISPIAAYEAGLSAEAKDTAADPLHRYACPDCGRPVRHLGYDGRCDRCAGLEVAEDKALRLEARRRLFRDTAQMLRRIGHPERAEYYERMLEGL